MASERQDMDPATLRWAASLLEDEARYVGKVRGQHWNQAADELRAQADFIERRREVVARHKKAVLVDVKVEARRG